MKLNKCRTLIVTIPTVIVITVTGVVILNHQFSNKRSALGRMARSWRGEYYVEQKANDLADDLRHIPALTQLQPWAVETMARFQAGQVRTNGGNSLFWADDAVTLAPEETPEFIKKQIGKTNKLGDVWPEISIVLSNSKPDYVVLKYGEWGIAVGSPEYRISFGPQWTNEVAPGVYTYSIEQ
jgi:hypothetical protein